MLLIYRSACEKNVCRLFLEAVHNYDDERKTIVNRYRDQRRGHNLDMCDRMVTVQAFLNLAVALAPAREAVTTCLCQQMIRCYVNDRKGELPSGEPRAALANKQMLHHFEAPVLKLTQSGLLMGTLSTTWRTPYSST